jgi:hypothetical protein
MSRYVTLRAVLEDHLEALEPLWAMAAALCLPSGEVELEASKV